MTREFHLAYPIPDRVKPWLKKAICRDSLDYSGKCWNKDPASGDAPWRSCGKLNFMAIITGNTICISHVNEDSNIGDAHTMMQKLLGQIGDTFLVWESTWYRDGMIGVSAMNLFRESWGYRNSHEEAMELLREKSSFIRGLAIK